MEDLYCEQQKSTSDDFNWKGNLENGTGSSWNREGGWEPGVEALPPGISPICNSELVQWRWPQRHHWVHTWPLAPWSPDAGLWVLLWRITSPLMSGNSMELTAMVGLDSQSLLLWSLTSDSRSWVSVTHVRARVVRLPCPQGVCDHIWPFQSVSRFRLTDKRGSDAERLKRVTSIPLKKPHNKWRKKGGVCSSEKTLRSQACS